MIKGRPGSLGAATSAGIILALALVLTGCTPTDGGADTQEEAAAAAPAEERSASAEESDVPADEPTSDDVEPADEADPPPAEQPAPDGACLVGEWTIPEAELQEFYGSVSTQASFTIVGDVALTFTEDTFEYLPDFVMEMEIAGQEAEGVVGGSVTGSYTSADGVITTANEDNSMEVAIRIGGGEFAGGDMAGSFLDQSPVNSAPYECGSDGLVLMFQTGASTDERIPMRLQRAG